MASILWNTEGDIYVRYFFGEIPFEINLVSKSLEKMIGSISGFNGILLCKSHAEKNMSCHMSF